MVFETPRLIIRQLGMADLEDFYSFHNDDEVMRYIRPTQNWDQAFEFLQKIIADYDQLPGYGRWAVVEKPGLHFIGLFMLRPSDMLPGHVEIGYAFFKDYWGRGYATEALQNGMDHAFAQMRIPTLLAVTHPENSASQKLLQKCGFVQIETPVLRDKKAFFFTIGNPLVVETSRLLVIPLNESILELYLEGEDKFETLLLLSRTGRIVAADVKESVSRIILPALKNAKGDHYLFHTFWIVIEKESKKIVAELGFKGRPEKTGSIEIGYGTMPDERGKGFMTEAVGGMIEWAQRREDVQYILVETDEKNVASIRVVEKNKFVFLEREGMMLWWKMMVK